MTPDVAVVISLNRFMAPVDDTVTAQHKSQVTSHKRRWCWNAASLTTDETRKGVLTDTPKAARHQEVYTSRQRYICCYVTTRDFLYL